MREETIKVFQFTELSDKAKEKAREWYRTTSQGDDYDDYFAETVIDDAKQIAALMGIEIKDIYYSGFSYQGDGASFTGHYRYQKGAVKAVKDYAPKDTELHRIAQELQYIQRKSFYRISCNITQSGYYQHENTMRFDFMLDGEYLYTTMAWESDLKDVLRDYARWIYKQLEESYDWENSDENVDETIIINEYEFTEDGSNY